MFRRLLPIVMISLILPGIAMADPPRVTADIAPIHSLVAQVMKGVASPDLLIRPEASPHRYSLRPSEAEALSRADVVFWMGEDLTPWLTNALSNLAGSATRVRMIGIEGTTVHTYRNDAAFEPDSHSEGDHHRHNHHHGKDPHAWLDPVNAQVWLEAIAEVLSKRDEANADTYQRNAREAITALDELIASIEARAEPLAGMDFIVFHDAYQYYERRFGLPATGAISPTDASDPSPARIQQIRNTVSDLGVTCVFTEPQHNPKLVRTVFEDTRVETVGVMDPLGADIEVGSDHYPQLMEAMINSLNQCRGQVTSSD